MNLLELVQGQLNDDVMARLAATLGESAPRTQQALSTGAIPAVLQALLARHGAASAGDQLVQLLAAGRHDGGLLTQIGSALGGGAHTDALLNVGKGLVANLLGDRSESVTELIASSTTIRRSSAAALLGLAAPLVLAVLGRERIDRNLDAAGLRALLATLPLSWSGHALPGLEIALGSPDPATKPAKSRSFWPWIVVPVAVVAATLGLRSCQQLALQAPPAPPLVPQVKPLPRAATPEVVTAKAEAAPPMTAPAVTPAAVTPAAVAPPASAVVAAPATTPAPTPAAPAAVLETVTAGIDKDSVAYELAQFLADPAQSAPRSFVLRNLTFDSGTADITRASRRTLQDVATVLQAYGTAKVMLQGHTDSVGNPTANYDLSLARANAAQAALLALGVDAARLSTAGFGADRPLQANDTPEGRAQNRRTELLVIVK